MRQNIEIIRIDIASMVSAARAPKVKASSAKKALYDKNVYSNCKADIDSIILKSAQYKQVIFKIVYDISDQNKSLIEMKLLVHTLMRLNEVVSMLPHDDSFKFTFNISYQNALALKRYYYGNPNNPLDQIVWKHLSDLKGKLKPGAFEGSIEYKGDHRAEDYNQAFRSLKLNNSNILPIPFRLSFNPSNSPFSDISGDEINELKEQLSALDRFEPANTPLSLNFALATFHDCDDEFNTFVRDLFQQDWHSLTLNLDDTTFQDEDEINNDFPYGGLFQAMAHYPNPLKLVLKTTGDVDLDKVFTPLLACLRHGNYSPNLHLVLPTGSNNGYLDYIHRFSKAIQSSIEENNYKPGLTIQFANYEEEVWEPKINTICNRVNIIAQTVGNLCDRVASSFAQRPPSSGKPQPSSNASSKRPRDNTSQDEKEDPNQSRKRSCLMPPPASISNSSERAKASPPSSALSQTN